MQSCKSVTFIEALSIIITFNFHIHACLALYKHDVMLDIKFVVTFNESFGAESIVRFSSNKVDAILMNAFNFRFEQIIKIFIKISFVLS